MKRLSFSDFPKALGGVLEELASLHGFIGQAHNHCTGLTPVLGMKCRDQGTLPGLGIQLYDICCTLCGRFSVLKHFPDSKGRGDLVGSFPKWRMGAVLMPCHQRAT